MDKKDFIIDMEFKRNFNDYEYLVYKIFFHAAATIKGVKPSSLLNFRNMPTINLYDTWHQYKGELEDKLHIKFMELRDTGDSVSVLFYNEDYLRAILCESECSCFLRDRGYKNCRAVEFALNELKEKYNSECPDEIGVFLGYPLDDVKMFLQKNEVACKMARYWKAYTDLPNALVIWNQYDEAIKTVMKELTLSNSPVDLLNA